MWMNARSSEKENFFRQTFRNRLRNSVRAKERTNSLVSQAGESGLSTSLTSCLSLPFYITSIYNKHFQTAYESQ